MQISEKQLIQQSTNLSGKLNLKNTHQKSFPTKSILKNFRLY